jgi:hypothetical protein
MSPPNPTPSQASADPQELANAYRSARTVAEAVQAILGLTRARPNLIVAETAAGEFGRLVTALDEARVRAERVLGLGTVPRSVIHYGRFSGSSWLGMTVEVARTVCNLTAVAVGHAEVWESFRRPAESEVRAHWRAVANLLNEVLGSVPDDLVAHLDAEQSAALQAPGLEVSAHARMKNEERQPAAPGRPADAGQALLTALMSAADLAKLLGQPTDRVETFLRRYRADHPDCCTEVDSRRTNEPRYLYRTADVWPALVQKLSEWRRLTDG